MPSHKPTLRDLAKKLDLALSTVSMSLKDHPRISVATRKRVKAAAKEMGYEPDPRISNVMGYLKKKRSDKPAAALAYITKFTKEIQLEKHLIFHNYLLGARERAKELGYHLDYFNMEQENLSGQRLTSVLLNRGIEGVIIPPIFSLQDTLDIDYEQFVSITFGYSLEHESINRVSLDHYSAVLQSLEEMNKCGYDKIGFVMEDMRERVQHRWRAAHLMFLDNHPQQIQIPALDRDYDRDSFLKWFFKYKPNGILSQRCDWVEYLHEEGLTCGVDYGFASLSQESAQHDAKKLSYPEVIESLTDVAGLDQNSFYTGRYAVELLAQEIALNLKGSPDHPKVTSINGQWRSGATLPHRAKD